MNAAATLVLAALLACPAAAAYTNVSVPAWGMQPDTGDLQMRVLTGDSSWLQLRLQSSVGSAALAAMYSQPGPLAEQAAFDAVTDAVEAGGSASLVADVRGQAQLYLRVFPGAAGSNYTVTVTDASTGKPDDTLLWTTTVSGSVRSQQLSIQTVVLEGRGQAGEQVRIARHSPGIKASLSVEELDGVQRLPTSTAVDVQEKEAVLLFVQRVRGDEQQFTVSLELQGQSDTLSDVVLFGSMIVVAALAGLWLYRRRKKQREERVAAHVVSS